ncbi:MAG: hypothetical protein AAGD86_13690 [Pseudomonadota bacterium]
MHRKPSPFPFFPWLPAAALLLASAAAQASYRESPVQVDVVADHHRPLAQYPVHTRGASGEYRAFVEASRGEHYAIRVRNHSAERVGVVIAVDGRNIISGRHSQLAPSERMYVLGPYESATYRGWRTGRDRVNRFYFTDASDSYAAAFDDRSALGVIAVAAYAPKHRRGRFQSEREETDYGRPGSAYPKSDGEARRRSAPSAGAYEAAPQADAAPGTGYGESRYSPSRRVRFEPRRDPVASVYLKYEWRSMLCRKGIVDCRREPPNRFWPQRYEDGYAPAPYARSSGSR